MTGRGESLRRNWKEVLSLTGRNAPELFEPGDTVAGTLYADEIRKALTTLKLTAVFCVQGVPTIAIVDRSEYDINEIVRIHAALWNQGLATVLVVITDDVVRIFSLAKAPGTGIRSEFEDRCLIDALNATAAVLSMPNFVSGAESGRLWHEYGQFFNPKDRIDAVLLNNLTETHHTLVHDGLSPEEAQAILIQTMFIAYLEDRDITGEEYFQSVTRGEHRDFAKLLGSGDVEYLERLFDQLRRDFNGDLFVAPCSFDSAEHPHRMTPSRMSLLERFRRGREEMSHRGGQLLFWGYDFEFIPVELISAVYDRFLGEDAKARKDAGAYYTPMYLVDTVVASVWAELTDREREVCSFLDPACGSGIFLVRCFQRMCEHWRATRKQHTIRWDSLQRMLARINGRDLNGGAVRIAVFSLYIALLEEVSPPDIRQLIRKGRLLPALWNNTLSQGDFFEEDPGKLRATVIIGNPPWASRRRQQSTGKIWAQGNRYPIPSGEEAWAFVWKARVHVEPKGFVAFLLPAMGFLHNHAAKSVAARRALFEQNKVIRVVNFADLRFQLFDNAISPAALIVFTPGRAGDQTYRFDYWGPKADLNLRIKRFISLSTVDKTRLSSADVAANELLFKQRLWMREPEAKLYRYLSSMLRLQDFIEQYGDLKKRGQDSDSGWVVGQGFKPFHGGERGSSSAQSHDSAYVGSVPYLPIEAFTPLALKADNAPPFGGSKVHRRGFERAFKGPAVLVPRGVKTSSMRLRAAYMERPHTFQHIFQAIVPPKGEERTAKLLTAVLNSRLVVWFAFHGTASFGADRPEVQQAELLRVPWPSAKDIENSSRSKKAEGKLVALIDDELRKASEVLRPDDADDVLQKIDRYTYDLFGLSNDEIMLIEDTVNYVLPAVQPSAGTYPELWRTSLPRHRKHYAGVLSKSLKEWFEGGLSVAISLIARNQDYAILKLALTDSRNETSYSECNKSTFDESLRELSEAIDHSLDRNFQMIPDMRVFVGDDLYLIKPLQLRFWLGSSALADADSIANDLETMLAAQRFRSAAS